MNFRVPGPTPVPPEVMAAMQRQMINHRSKEFAEIFRRVTAGLQHFFHTESDVLIFATSGTGGLEAAVVNTLSPGDRVLGVSIGYFGERFLAIARAYGAEVRELAFPWGKAADPSVIREELQRDPEIKAVLVTHNETSTGVVNDLETIAQVVRGTPALLVVDAISSLGAVPLPMDEWGVDVLITGSQKAWMIPPGLAMVGISPRAWAAHKSARMPRFYFDFTAAKQLAARGSVPFTPAISLFYGLDKALELMAEEGREAIFERHRRVGERARQGVKGLGLELLAEERYASNTVTAIKVPEEMDGELVLERLLEEHGVALGGGPGKMAGRLWRIGHLGWVQEADIDGVMAALGAVLSRG